MSDDWRDDDPLDEIEDGDIGDEPIDEPEDEPSYDPYEDDDDDEEPLYSAPA